MKTMCLPRLAGWISLLASTTCAQAVYLVDTGVPNTPPPALGFSLIDDRPIGTLFQNLGASFSLPATYDIQTIEFYVALSDCGGGIGESQCLPGPAPVPSLQDPVVVSIWSAQSLPGASTPPVATRTFTQPYLGHLAYWEQYDYSGLRLTAGQYYVTLEATSGFSSALPFNAPNPLPSTLFFNSIDPQWRLDFDPGNSIGVRIAGLLAPIPEPNTSALAFVGLLVVIGRKLRKQLGTPTR